MTSTKRGNKEKKKSVSAESKYDTSMSLHQIKGELRYVCSCLPSLCSKLNFAFLPIYSGRIVRVGKDQDGSRYIQQRLAIADASEIELVFDEAMPAIEGKFHICLVSSSIL